MAKKTSINVYGILTDKDKLESSIRDQWDSLIMEPNEKTYYLFESVYRLAKTNKESHIFILELLLDLNNKEEYQSEEDRKIMIQTLNKALKELKDQK